MKTRYASKYLPQNQGLRSCSSDHRRRTNDGSGSTRRRSRDSWSPAKCLSVCHGRCDFVWEKKTRKHKHKHKHDQTDGQSPIRQHVLHFPKALCGKNEDKPRHFLVSRRQVAANEAEARSVEHEWDGGSTLVTFKPHNTSLLTTTDMGSYSTVSQQSPITAFKMNVAKYPMCWQCLSWLRIAGHGWSCCDVPAWQALWDELTTGSLTSPTNRQRQFLGNVNTTSRSLYAVACPSVCCLSVCNVRAPYSVGWNFQQFSYAIWYLGLPLISTKIQ